MTYYFVILLIASALMFVAQNLRNWKGGVTLFFLMTLAVLVFLPSIRAMEVGADTHNYYDMFVYKRHVKLTMAELVGGVEPGFALFQRLIQRLTEDFVLFLFAIAIFVVGIYMFIFRRLSEHYGVTMFVFIALGIYLFFFNGARQAMAAAVYSLAIFPMLKKQFFKYALIVILAASFHKTVIIMLPLYFVFGQKVSFRQMVMLVILSAVIASGLSIVMSLAPTVVHEKYSDYHNRTAGGGVLLMIVYVILAAFFLYARKFIDEKDLKTYDIYLNFSIFTSVVYVMVNLTGQDVNIIRFTLYTSIGYMLIWPLIVRNLGLFRSIVPWIAFYAVHLIFFYVYINKMIGPFIVNPDLF